MKNIYKKYWEFRCGSPGDIYGLMVWNLIILFVRTILKGGELSLCESDVVLCCLFDSVAHKKKDTVKQLIAG